MDGDKRRIQRRIASHAFSVNSVSEYTMITLREEVRGKRFPVLEYLAREKRPVDRVEQHSLNGSFPTCPLAAAFDVVEGQAMVRCWVEEKAEGLRSGDSLPCS